MAATTEHLFPCSDCGATAEERAAMGDKMNYIHTRRINGNVHFLSRCRACHAKRREECQQTGTPAPAAGSDTADGTQGAVGLTAPKSAAN